MNSDELYNLYQTAKFRSDEFYETNDCTVTSIAIATGEGYEMAHYAMEEAGRVPRRGATIAKMRKACEMLGYEMVRVEPATYKARTPITLERENLPGAYIVSFATHVAAVVDGKVLDWVQGRRFRIESLFKITKK